MNENFFHPKYIPSAYLCQALRQPYFTLQGNICALLGAKDHLNIFIYDPLVPDPEGIINQGQGNQTARAIQVRQGETINQRALLNLFQAIIARNRAGGGASSRRVVSDIYQYRAVEKLACHKKTGPDMSF